MKERPIIFNAEMIRAILNNRKSQTRRVIKPQPNEPSGGSGWQPWRYFPCVGKWCLWQPWRSNDGNDTGAHVRATETSDYPYLRCPYGVPGDRLWVRETWCEIDNTEFGGDKYVDYKATPEDGCDEAPGGWHAVEPKDRLLRWCSPRYMPRWASRITLEITDVRVQRVQEISEADIIAEGCPSEYLLGKNWFMSFWNSINAKRGYPWESNQWVWALTFKRVDQ